MKEEAASLTLTQAFQKFCRREGIKPPRDNAWGIFDIDGSIRLCFSLWETEVEMAFADEDAATEWLLNPSSELP